MQEERDAEWKLGRLFERDLIVKQLRKRASKLINGSKQQLALLQAAADLSRGKHLAPDDSSRPSC